MKRTSNPEEEDDVDDNIGLGGRRIIVARPRSLSPESDASSPENLQVITANMKKGMKKSLSSRLGPVDPGVQQQQFSEKEIYEEMLRQQERRRIAIEEKEIRKLKKAMKKKEKLERKLKKHDKKESKKKSKKVQTWKYPSTMRSSYLAGLSHTGQVQVGFFSFIIKKSEASKHCNQSSEKGATH